MGTLFKLSSLAVLPFWALMIFLPRWSATKRLMMVIPRFAEVWRAVSSPEISGIAALLGSPVGATVGWLHFLAFDLFVGRWIYLDGRERGVSAWVVAPVLFVTLMLGHCGFLLYVISKVSGEPRI